ncbi:hypothetical protein BGW36DRAFT_379155 [Talaromyces proteolyticus]|uniref:Phosphotransferase n=1 Tax=Talaromyces proteolyticus TaxID=1131652 RepID=A0AAD4KRH9_9EURO|nr:uncharacterized protein BGW36DRAFT_379155 [Talaromyces proteolyticus]KAH8697639.1 hypothetical protein BGW36DRAFT_379155 [Talaromyces proteolyticus]
MTQSKHKVPSDVMVNQSYHPLFDFIAEKISDFLIAHPDQDCKNIRATDHSPYRLGFTFSFTCEQTSLEGGTLIHWDKGWDIPEAIGRDPCVMLQEAIDKLRLPVLVTVLANDSVGALLTRSYTSHPKDSTLGAVIFGTGTNAAYIEKLSNVQRLAIQGDHRGIMVINTEWGCLGDNNVDVLPRTSFDDELDKDSTDPGAQMLEKRVSGLYLGELLRLTILRLLEVDAFNLKFNKNSPIFQKEGINSAFLSELAIAKTKNTTNASKIIQETLMAENVATENVATEDAQAIQLLATRIVRRAGRLAGASLSAIIIQSGRLEASHKEGKYHDTEVKEYETPAALDMTINSVERFTWRLRLVWRRILQLLGMDSLVGTSIPCIRHQQIPEPVNDRLEENVIDIGADGSLIEFYPNFEAEMRGAMREVPEIGHHGERRVRIGLTKDGSGVGAALMAQAAMESEALSSNRGVRV